MCMYSQSNAIGLGRYTNGPYWYINTLDPLNFTVTYYDGDKISSTATYVLVFQTPTLFSVNLAVTD